MDPVPQALIQSMQRTLAFAVDEQVMRLPLAQGQQLAANIEPVGLCVFTRNQIRIYTLRERILLMKVRHYSILTKIITYPFTFSGYSSTRWSCNSPPLGPSHVLDRCRKLQYS